MKTLIISSLLFFGCAHQEKANFDQYTFLDFKMKSPVNRVPAAEITEEELKDEIEKEETKIAEERLYFLSLYAQLKTMQKISYNSDHHVRSCPAFHTDFIENQNQESTHLSNAAKISKPSVNDASLYPFISLMKTNKQNIHNIMSSFELVKIKTFNEINELCERGQTDQMFVYLNLQDHLHQNKDFRFTREAVSAMVKIPVFENIFFLGTLYENERFSPYVLSSSEKEMISRMRGEVLTHYIDFVYTQRYDRKHTHMSAIGRK
jgi:hypothetical protein